MMLRPIETFDNDTRLAALFRSWCAICPETGAFLSASRGRSKAGNGRRYILIAPNELPSERPNYFEDYTWTDDRRKFVRAFSDAEAIEKANKKLAEIEAQL